MKKTILSAIMLSCSLSFAVENTIQYDLLVESYSKKTKTIEQFLLSSLNKKISKLEHYEFPSKVIISEKTDAQKKKEQLDKDIKHVNSLLNIDLNLVGDSGSGAFFNEIQNLCYTGNPTKVLKLINLATGSFFQENQIYAVRAKKNKFIAYKDSFFENNKDDEQYYINNGFKKAITDWKKFKTNSDSVLVLYTFGPQGDGSELLSIKIEKCKK